MANKRRSQHGIATMGPPQDFHIFDDTTDTSSAAPDYDMVGSSSASSSATLVATNREPIASPTHVSLSTTPTHSRRSSSLRKSTLQQRYGERSSWGRRLGAHHLAQMIGEPGTPVQKSRPRLSVDQFVPLPISRDSPFSPIVPLPNPSSHPIDQQQQQQQQPQPHPLSKTLTSGNILADSKPISDKPKSNLGFSKSLPYGSRPVQDEWESSRSISTPKLDSDRAGPVAFHSTGLISKVNRNPEAENEINPMPDTPCKKSLGGYNTFPPQLSSAKNKRMSLRLSGASASYTNSESRASFGKVPKGLGLFQRFNGPRRGSILSQEEDRTPPSSSASSSSLAMDMYTGLESDAPPTPTKQTPKSWGVAAAAAQDSSISPTVRRVMAAPPPLSSVPVSRRETSSPIERLRTPRTPQADLLGMDQGFLSISRQHQQQLPPPVTPTGRETGKEAAVNGLVTPANGRNSYIEIDGNLLSRFSKAEAFAQGEFSTVFKVTTASTAKGFDALGLSTSKRTVLANPSNVFAVKRNRHPYHGAIDRATKLREVQALERLRNANHVLPYIDSWEDNGYLYIQTEYCEEGTLKSFLSQTGQKARLDDFRIWKIMLEVCVGLREIHDAGFMHLDMKPANVFVTWEGVLKIGDFGLAMEWPATKGVDCEGDREYLAGEILQGHVDKPADVFSLGLMLLEIAGNCILPHNGPTWTALREANLGDIANLTISPSQAVQRDVNGLPIDLEFHMDTSSTPGIDRTSAGGGGGGARNGSSLYSHQRMAERPYPPDFMADMDHPSSLDHMFRWMINPDPAARPTVHELLQFPSMQWVDARRNSPATIFEGNWGPDDNTPLYTMDSEMTDV